MKKMENYYIKQVVIVVALVMLMPSTHLGLATAFPVASGKTLKAQHKNPHKGNKQ